MQDAKDIVGHALEFRFKSNTDDDAFVLSIQGGRSSGIRGNLMRDGIYRPELFDAGAYHPGSWNQVRLQSCADGKIHLLFNGREASRTLESGLQSRPFLVRAVGLRATVSLNPGPPKAIPSGLLPPPPGL
jgi:hypothetical protein